jgi:hypothetical protein
LERVLENPNVYNFILFSAKGNLWDLQRANVASVRALIKQGTREGQEL